MFPIVGLLQTATLWLRRPPLASLRSTYYFPAMIITADAMTRESDDIVRCRYANVTSDTRR